MFKEGTLRVCAPSETLSRILPTTRHFGVTRTANVTGLDRIGIPVAVAMRPNSRSLSIYQGKGLSLDAAKASAIMEAYESACAENLAGRAVCSSVNALAGRHRLVPDHLARPGYRPDLNIPWIAATELFSQRAILVPEEAVTTDYRRPQRPGFSAFRSTTNGLASGNTQEEAMLHALCELIERDALAIWNVIPEHCRLRTRIDPSQVGYASVQSLMERYDAAAITVHLWDITSDIEVPAFFCLIDDERGDPPFLGRFGGSGCHPIQEIAICRALTEAAQSRLTVIVGSRDDISIDVYTYIGWHSSLSNIIFGRATGSAAPARAPSAATCRFDTPADALSSVLSQLSDHGVGTVVYVELTDPIVGMPCLKALAPELEAMPREGEYTPRQRARDYVRRLQ